MTHNEPHPYAGQTVHIGPNAIDPAQHAVVPGAEYRVEDWWDRVSGESWMQAVGNPAALHYAIRSVFASLPLDDEVVYGHDARRLGHIVHVSELELPAGPTPIDGPADTDLVWMSVRRKGIDAHRPDGPDHTACGRPMRPYGEQLTAGEARAAYSALLCARCWPGLHIPHTQRVARRSL